LAHRNNKALWSGEFTGDFTKLSTSNDDVLYCFKRKKDSNEVVVLTNFSDKPQKIDFTVNEPEGEFKSIFNNEVLSLYTKGGSILPPYGYQVFVKQ
jgi:glycosidase